MAKLFVNGTQTPMPANLNLRDVGDSNNALDIFMARHPDWGIGYTLEAGYNCNRIEVVINAANSKGSFVLTGKARQSEIADLLEEMEARLLRALARDSVRADEWNVKRDFADVTMVGSGELQRIPLNTEYTAFMEYGKSPPRKKKLFDADSIIGQAMEKAAEFLREDIKRGTLFGTGKMLDSIKVDEDKRVTRDLVGRIEPAAREFTAAERERLMNGQWPVTVDENVPKDKIVAIPTSSTGRPVPDIITRKTFDRLGAQEKMDFVKLGGKVVDSLPPGVKDIAPEQVVITKKYRANPNLNERINRRGMEQERAADLERLQRNIERATEVARQQKLKEAMELLRQNGIAVNPTVALNAGGNANPSSPQQPTTATFEDKSKPRRRIRLAKQ